MTTLKAYRCFFQGAEWCELVFAGTANRARSYFTDEYGTPDPLYRNDTYFAAMAHRLPHMDEHTKEAGVVHDQSLIDLSGIHNCEHCGRDLSEICTCDCEGDML